MKQRIQSSHLPPCHKHMAIALQLSQCIVLPCCTAAQTRLVPNVALSSPNKVAIKCFLDCWVSSSPSEQRRLVIYLAHRGIMLRLGT